MSQSKVRILSCPCCAGPIEQEISTGQSIRCVFCNTALRIGPVRVEKRSNPVLLPGLKSLEVQAAAINRLFTLIRLKRHDEAARLFSALFGRGKVAGERAVKELRAGRMVTGLGLTLVLPRRRTLIRRALNPAAVRSLLGVLSVGLGMIIAFALIRPDPYASAAARGPVQSPVFVLSVVALISIVLYLFLNSRVAPTVMRLRGRAVVLSSKQVGRGSRVGAVLRLEVEIAPDDGKKFRVTTRKALSAGERSADYAVGTTHRVLYDHKNREDVKFCWLVESEDESGILPYLPPGEEATCPKCGSPIWCPPEPSESVVCDFCGSASAAPHTRESDASRLLPGFHSEEIQRAAIAELRDLVVEGHREEEAKRLYASIFSTDKTRAARGIRFLSSGRPVREHGMNLLPRHLTTMTDLLQDIPTSSRARLKVGTLLAGFGMAAVIALGALLMPGNKELAIWLLWMGPVVILGLLGWLAESRTMPTKHTARARWSDAPARIISREVLDTPHNFSILRLRVEVRPPGKHPFEAELKEWALSSCARRIRPGSWLKVRYDPVEVWKVVMAER